MTSEPAKADHPSPSALRSREFYRRLGAAGLAIRTKPEWDRQTLRDLRELIPASGRVLDVGCGYGRMAIPLAELGYEVTGIDIAPGLLRTARRDAARHGVSIRLDEGSMTALPYAEATFDAVISLWSAFYELLEEAEQVEALTEMARVLRPGGIGVIEGPVFVEATPADIETGRRHGPGLRLVEDRISGHPTGHYVHDAASLLGLAGAAGVARAEVVERSWGGRLRQILTFGPSLPAEP
jgi:SAM-dependent methyltransferase